MMSANTNSNKRLCVHRTPSSSSLESNTEETTTAKATTTTTTSLDPTALTTALSALQSTSSTTTSQADPLAAKRLNYYLTQTILATKSGNTSLASTTSERAKSLIRSQWPHTSEAYQHLLYIVNVTNEGRKHSLPPKFSKELLEATPLSSLEESEKQPLGMVAGYYFNLSLCRLELGELDDAEEAANAGLARVQKERGEVGGEDYEHIACFILALIWVKKGDMVEAGFWKEMVPSEKEKRVADTLCIREEEMEAYRSIVIERAQVVGEVDKGWGIPLQVVTSTTTTTGAVKSEGVTGQRLEKDLGEIWDVVSMNYREVCERIKSIHRIMDEKEKSDAEKQKEEDKKVRRVGILKTATKEPAIAAPVATPGAASMAELEELKRKVEYLERTMLR